jgi:predicted HicB family RNase H-like nuclease
MKNQPNDIRMGEADKVLNNKKLEVQDYLSMPYTYLVQRINDESGNYFYGRILELDGCQITGNTAEEVYKNLNEAMESYIETKLDNNIEIPQPLQAEDFSDKFVVRLPKTLHQRLAIEAKKEGVSLNQFALYNLTR